MIFFSTPKIGSRSRFLDPSTKIALVKQIFSPSIALKPSTFAHTQKERMELKAKQVNWFKIILDGWRLADQTQSSPAIHFHVRLFVQCVSSITSQTYIYSKCTSIGHTRESERETKKSTTKFSKELSIFQLKFIVAHASKYLFHYLHTREWESKKDGNNCVRANFSFS